MRSKLAPGTVCLIRSKTCPQHDGKVVTVVKERGRDFYQCSPDLIDGGEYIDWSRRSLVPLDGGDGMDEMLRITGKPQEVASA